MLLAARLLCATGQPHCFEAVTATLEAETYSKKFRAEHEADILIHQAAKKYFDGLGVQKLPTVKALREEYAEVLEAKRKAYAEYKQARAEMRELQNVQAKIDYLLGHSTGRENARERQ